ncbi:MAG: hypothetical protein M0D53_12480 [Flavobacterium sp. JAD_PAG50586_2]|nr:MAG: hypothetical protein M0D53_12480 [Flavobacterium sp. JAD_PAG50586_2]
MEDYLKSFDNDLTVYLIEDGKKDKITSDHILYNRLQAHVFKGRMILAKKYPSRKEIDVYIEIFDDTFKTEPRVFIYVENKLGKSIKRYMDI